MLMPFRKSMYFIICLSTLSSCGGGKGSDKSNDTTPENPDVITVGQPENASSGGALQLSELRVSRNECTSPCPVIFSVDDLEDATAINPFTDTGIYWDYGDEQADERDGLYTKGAKYFLAGRQSDTGASRESDTNTPITMHTYFCEEGTCKYYPGVSLLNANGDWVTAWTTITVHAVTTTFPSTGTVCYSTSGNFDGCPEGAVRTTTNMLPLHNDWQSNTRYLLRRGEVFTSSDPPRICIAYDRENIYISSFGAGGLKAEIAEPFGIGADSGCSDLIVNDAQVSAISIPNWNRNITVTDVRLHSLRLGMSFSDITLHNIDMDYESSVTGGGYVIMENSNNCSNNVSLFCGNVPLPKIGRASCRERV